MTLKLMLSCHNGIPKWPYTHPGISSINNAEYEELVFPKAEESYFCYRQGFDLINTDHAPRMREDKCWANPWHWNKAKQLTECTPYDTFVYQFRCCGANRPSWFMSVWGKQGHRSPTSVKEDMDFFDALSAKIPDDGTNGPDLLGLVGICKY